VLTTICGRRSWAGTVTGRISKYSGAALAADGVALAEPPLSV